MKQETKFLLEIVKYILNNKKAEFPIPCKEINWNILLRIARKHSIMNFLYYALNYLPSNAIPNEKICEYLYNCAMQEIVRSYNQIEATKELLARFEKEKIYVAAVKGICIKKYYPELDMRTMKDIDILCKDSQQKQIHKVMLDLGYSQSGEGQKHDYYLREPHICLEMHRVLVSADSLYSEYYDTVWDKLQKKENHHYVYEMTKEDEYIFTFVHLVEHFLNGGVGIRFIMDVYLYNQMMDLDRQYIQEQLKYLELWEFFQNISLLAEMWFGANCESIPNETILRLSEYIISNGTFGSQTNSASLAVAGHGKNCFIWKVMFPNLRSMQSMFPWLKKYPFLLPYSWILRGLKGILFRREHIKTQVNRYRYGDKKYGDELKEFYKSCGL